MITEFADAVLGRRAALHDARWGLDTMACCAALLASSRCDADVAPESLMDQPEPPCR